jgi:hypothetical protein
MAILQYLLFVLPCGRPLTCMSVVEACEIIQLRQRNGRFWSWSMHITRFHIILEFQLMSFNCSKVFKKPKGLNLKLTASGSYYTCFFTDLTHNFLNIWSTLMLYILYSMTHLFTHSVAHSTKPSSRPKTNPLKSF